jgi:hypothetical protein
VKLVAEASWDRSSRNGLGHPLVRAHVAADRMPRVIGIRWEEVDAADPRVGGQPLCAVLPMWRWVKSIRLDALVDLAELEVGLGGGRRRHAAS